MVNKKKILSLKEMAEMKVPMPVYEVEEKVMPDGSIIKVDRERYSAKKECPDRAAREACGEP